MDKDTSSHAADTPEGSAGDDGGQAKYPAVKDRKCQYCQQAFTSSSLGRHLDQFLYKKKPDGIHDIEEIRRIRSGITRRQARTSSGRPGTVEGSEMGQADTPTSDKEGGQKPRGGTRMMLNTPTWHATGVINDIPNPNGSRESGRWHSSPLSTGSVLPASRGSGTPNADTMRALELALREVLDNVKAAAA